MKIKILPQPDDNTCGPTSLHAVYNYLGLEIKLSDIINGIDFLGNGGTLAVFLGIDALKRGFDATIYSYNLKIFDPTWKNCSSESLIKKLKAQASFKKGNKFRRASRAYIEFLEKGGSIRFEMLTPDLLKSYLQNNTPILAGLSATYLYRSKREVSDADKSSYDDIIGEPMGHFVVLSGYRNDNRVKIADPYGSNPFYKQHYYAVEVQRLINAIHLGIVTYDANILIIRRRDDLR